MSTKSDMGQFEHEIGFITGLILIIFLRSL